MKIESLDRFFERAILALVLAILVFAPLAMGAVGAQEFLVVQALVMGVMLLWGLRILVIPGIKLFWPPLCWVVLAFSVYAIARYLTADIEYVARLEMIQTLVYAFLFFAVVNNLTLKESTQVISFPMIFLGVGISCYAVFQYLTHSSRVWDEISPYHSRAMGTYISPNDFSCFLEMLLPLALAYLLASRIKPLTRILLGYAILVMAAALAMTFSRGGWVASGIGIVALLMLLMCHRQHRLGAILILVVMLAAGTIFVTHFLSDSLSYVTRVDSISRTGHVGMEFRTEMWRAAEQMWGDHFWFGVGPALYDYRFPQYRPETVQMQPDRAHNDYLNLLADWGTTGGIIVAAGIIIFAVSLFKTWKAVHPEARDPARGMSNRFAFFAGASAALLALAAHSFVDFNLHIPANALLGVSLLALLTGQFRFATDGCRFDPRLPGRMVWVGVLAGGLCYFGIQGTRRLKESVWIARGQNPQLTVLTRAGLLEKAYAAEPKNFETAYDIAELYRIQSFQGTPDYEAQAKSAMKWYSRAMKLDPYDGDAFLGYGMCLDWLGDHEKSEKFFSRAEALDPNSYFIAANIGWHYIQAGDYAAARSWMQRSLLLGPGTNPMAQAYWEIVQNKLSERASGQALLPAGF